MLRGREEKFAVSSSADVQIGSRDFRTHGSIDEFLQRYIQSVAACVPHVKLNFFDRRHGLRDTVFSLLELNEIGCENTAPPRHRPSSSLLS